MGISFHQIQRSSRAIRFFCFFFIALFTGQLLHADEFSYIEERVAVTLDSLIGEGYPFATVAPYVDSQGVWELRVETGKQYADFSIEQQGSDLRAYVFNGLVSPYRSFRTLITGVPSFKRYLEFSSVTDSVHIGGLYERGDSLILPVWVVSQKDFFLNGAIGYSNKSEQGVNGDFSIALRNSFGFGEELSFSYNGDKDEQQIGTQIQLPYLFSLPLLFHTILDVEVSEETGLLTLNSAISYLLPTLQEVGIGFDHYKVDDDQGSTKYNGVLLYLRSGAVQWEKGTYKARYGATLSTGFRLEQERHYYINMKGKVSGQFPIGAFAMRGLLSTGFIKSDAPDLKIREKFRLGGRDVMRGYTAKSIPAISYGAGELTWLYYLNRFAAIYVTNELAIKAESSLSFGDLSLLYDYGIGLTYPVRRVEFNIELMKAIEEPFRNARIRVNITKR